MKKSMVWIIVLVLLAGGSLAYIFSLNRINTATETKNLVEEGNYVNSLLKPKWLGIHNNNKEFSLLAHRQAKDKKTSRAARLQKIKAMAQEYRSKLEAYGADFKTVAVPPKFANFNENLIQAIRENIAYYSSCIEICGEPQEAQYEKVRSSAEKASEKYFECFKEAKNDHGIVLDPEVESANFTQAIDRMSFIVKSAGRPMVVNLTGVSNVAPVGGSYSSSNPSRQILRNYLARYDALRTETQEAVNRAKGGDHAAYALLVTGKEKRNQLKAEILAASIDSSYEAIKNDLISVIDYSMSAFDMLMDGNYPGFVAKSDQITALLNRIDSALR